ncbi:unnamed protein product [Musa acuminata subsp. malaccensis]|uniref:(wild Malaysian banana) hypothetical protein n=1 Tax=Musa acuminata subsp. malaccensis TaxID=214687 RepID=A0A804L6E1_MUSAM|nr:unnamed protein product [Musa acuminata subsp. malaccensis]
MSLGELSVSFYLFFFFLIPITVYHISSIIFQRFCLMLTIQV